MGSWREVWISQRVVSTVILINALALFLHGFYAEGTNGQKLWFAVDYACVVFFVVEITLRIAARRSAFFSSGGNWFDFLIVLASMPTLLAPLIGENLFSVVLLLRLGRLLRLFRLLTFIPDRENLALGLKRALRASVGVFLALILINVILAIGATSLFRETAPEYFGNPFISVNSLLRAFTVDGWYEIPNVLAARTESPLMAFFARLFFILTVLAGGILGLSLANAVFVDEMLLDNSQAIEKKLDALSEELRALRRQLADKSSKTD